MSSRKDNDVLDTNRALPSSDPDVSTDASSDIDDGTLPKGTFDPVYEAKARVLNRAIREIGMGRYQWQLFVVIGFGWASDNLWPIVTSLILGPASNEFGASRPPILTLAQNIGHGRKVGES